MGSLGEEDSFPYPAPPLCEILSGGGREKEEKIINITKQVLQNILRSRLPVSASSTIVCEFKKQNTFFTQNWMMLTTSFAITMNQHTCHLYQSLSAQIRYPDSFLPFHYCMKIKKHQHNFYTVYQKGRRAQNLWRPVNHEQEQFIKICFLSKWALTCSLVLCWDRVYCRGDRCRDYRCIAPHTSYNCSQNNLKCPDLRWWKSLHEFSFKSVSWKRTPYISHIQSTLAPGMGT